MPVPPPRPPSHTRAPRRCDSCDSLFRVYHLRCPGCRAIVESTWLSIVDCFSLMFLMAAASVAIVVGDVARTGRVRPLVVALSFVPILILLGAAWVSRRSMRTRTHATTAYETVRLGVSLAVLVMVCVLGVGNVVRSQLQRLEQLVTTPAPAAEADDEPR